MLASGQDRRKHSEMKLSNLAAAGEALKDLELT